MLGCDTGAVVAYCHLQMADAFQNRNVYCSVLRCVSERVIEQISHDPLKQIRVGVNLSLATALDRHVVIVCHHLVERGDLFDRCACIEALPRDWFTGRIHACHEEQIVYDPGKPLTLANGRFDNLAVLGGGAISRKGDLRFAEHIGDRRSKFVRKIGRELREPGE